MHCRLGVKIGSPANFQDYPSDEHLIVTTAGSVNVVKNVDYD